MVKRVKIGNLELGDGLPCRIIAELSCNHNGSIEIAKKSILEMSKCGVDIVKLQTSRPGMITLDCDKPDFVINTGTIWDSRKLFDLYKETNTPWEWHGELFLYAKSLGMEIFSSPFDLDAIDFLESLNCPAYKIASFEITDTGLIAKAASTQKPIIISTGIAEKKDIELAINTCFDQGNKNVLILKCTSAYPAPLDEINLNLMRQIREDFNVLVGLSDHTLGDIVPIVSKLIGGCVVEKHFILDRNMGGPDSSFSMNSIEFKKMIDTFKDIDLILGSKSYELGTKSKLSRKYARSLYYTKDLKAGQFITNESVRSVRPGMGLHPKFLPEILNNVLIKDVCFGDPVSLSDLQENLL